MNYVECQNCKYQYDCDRTYLGGCSDGKEWEQAMKKTNDPYMAHTPQEEIYICEHCPYPKPRCGSEGCEHFRERKAQILAERNDRRRFRKENIARLKGAAL